MLKRFALLCSMGACLGAGLLPQPREMREGSGKLPLVDVTIGFARVPSAEDQTVAHALAGVLGVKTRMVSARPMILLERTADESSWGLNPSEEYSLEVTKSNAKVRARTARGLFYGVQTLRQLVRREGGQAVLPEVQIQDRPELPLRGFMLDLSHGPFPKMDELKRQLDFLALWKANQFYLYSETNIELDGFSLLSPTARLSKAQVRELVAYARERFIDVVPCVELYGHLHDLAKIERYSDLGETPHGGEIDPRNPKSLELVRNWVDQLVDMFPSPYFHVGMDETYELGKMPGRELKPEESGAVYLRFFEQVSQMVSRKGKQVMVWGDIILQHPEVIPRLPAGTIAIPWKYADQESYDEQVAPLASAKVKFLAGTGVWNYYDAAPDFHHTIRNVNGSVKSVRKHGGLGIVHTEWTDSGQVLFRGADPGVAFGPVGAWQDAPMQPSEFYDRYSRLQHPQRSAKAAQALQAISDAQGVLEKALGTRTLQAVFTDPFDPRTLERASEHVGELKAGRRRAEDAQELLLELSDPVFDDLLYGARVLDYAAMRQIYALEIAAFTKSLTEDPKRSKYRLLLGIETSDHTHSRLFDLMDSAGEIERDLERLWLRDFVPYRLNTALGRWRAEVERWRSLQAKLFEGYRNYRDGDRPPSLR